MVVIAAPLGERSRERLQRDACQALTVRGVLLIRPLYVS
jgi:hypothetical protein